MSAWEHPSKDLFRAGRGASAPSAADRERVRARLAAKLGAAAVGAAITTTAGTAGGATASAAAAGSAKGGVLALVAKIAVPVVLVGGAATIAAPRLAKMHEAPATTPAATATILTQANAPKTEPAPAPVPVETTTVSVGDLPTAPVAPVVSGSAPRAKASAADPAEEARLVAAIDDALRTGDAAHALRLADEHAKKFPSGVLVEEREGGRAIARCMNGSRSSADAFLGAHPRSPMRGRIVAACGEKP